MTSPTPASPRSTASNPAPCSLGTPLISPGRSNTSTTAAVNPCLRRTAVEAEPTTLKDRPVRRRTITLSGGSLHDTGRRARRGRAAGRLPRAVRPALRQGAGPGPRLRLPQGTDGLPRAEERRADRPAGRARRRLRPPEVRRRRPVAV